MTRRTLAVLALTLVAGAVLAVALVPATCQARTAKVTALSRSSAKVGARLTIRGSNFGSRQGRSTVTFGERPNALGFAPCSKKARVVSWSSSSITVRVPRMSPGKAGEPGTYHPVYVTVGGRKSNSANFYIDPVTTITTGTSAALANSVIPSSNSTWTPSTATYSSASTTGVFPATGTANVLFDGVTFTATNGTLAGYAYGVLTLGGNRTHQNITFLNCTFTNNLGPGSGGDYGVNGVKVVNWGAQYCHDVSFVGCNFGTPNGGASAFQRMGYEQVQNVAANAATNVAIIDCIFEPVGGECISNNAGNLYQLISGCTFKGAGNRVAPDYLGVIEFNSSCYVEVRDSDMWRPNCPALNMAPVPGSPNSDRHLLFKNIDVDATHAYQTVPLTFDAMFMTSQLSYARFDGCRFNTGTSTTHYRWAGAANTWGMPPHAWNTCTYNDFRGSTISGYVGSGLPATAAGYWDTGVHATNSLPTVVR